MQNVSNSDAANVMLANNFPPSLEREWQYESVTEFVDAFPMANGIQLRTLITVNIIK